MKDSFTSKAYLISIAPALPIRVEITGGEASDYKGDDLLYEKTKNC